MNRTNWISLAISSFFISAHAVTLVPYGAAWKYRDDGSNPGTAWRAPGFDDSAWASGPAQLGYGDGDEATMVAFVDVNPTTSGVQKNATTYFRTSFFVQNVTAIEALSLQLLFDDAGAVYINGTEVARTPNLVANAAYNVYASSQGSDNAVTTWTLAADTLVAGTNTIAAEIHQASATSSDVSFDLQLTDLPSASDLTVTRGPYLQLNNASGITLRWRTSLAANSVVTAGTTLGAPGTAVTNLTPTTEHEVRVEGLSPDTKYFYSIGTTDEMLAGNDADYFFMTTPVSGTDRPMRVWALGDCGTGDANERAVRNAYYNSSIFGFTDLVLLLGDNAYDTGTDNEFQNAIFNMFPTVLRQSPLWSCLGNHEVAQDKDGVYAAPYFSIFSLPTAAECGGYPSGTERYFSWEFGNIHFLSIDTQTDSAALRANMLTWLENDLAANTRRWTVACFHHPAYTKGSHNSDTEEQLIWTRANVIPRLEAAGVDLVLNGHSHSYERSWMIDGFYATPSSLSEAGGRIIDGGDGRDDGDGGYGKDYGSNQGAVYVVAGSAGKISGGSLNHPLMYKSLNRLGSMVLDISGNRLDAKFLNSAGVFEDYFSIEKGPLVTLSTPVPDAAEYGPVTGRVTVTRSGSMAHSLTVQLNLGGTAPGSRYAPVTLPITVPAGAASALVDLVPVPDAVLQGPQTVVFAAASNVEYRVGTESASTVFILDAPTNATPIAYWQLVQFAGDANRPAITGDAVDGEGDGLPNLLEYALVSDVAVPDSPFPGVFGNAKWTIRFKHDAGRSDVDLELLWTDDLQSQHWIPIVRSLGGGAIETLNGATLIKHSVGNPSTVEVGIPNQGPRAFIRWKATRK